MEQHRLWPLAAIAVSIAAFLLASVAFVVSVANAVNGPSGSGGGSGRPAPSASSENNDLIEVELSEWAVTAATAEVDAGHIRFEVNNVGAIPHTLGIEGLDVETPSLNGGESAVVDAGELAPGTYRLICTIPGHVAAGMASEFTVVAAGGGTGEHTEPGSATGGGGHASPEDMEATMAASLAAFPAETAGEGAQPLAPEVLEDGTKLFELVVDEVEWEVEPGRIVDAVAYNGQVPGPTMKVDVGDRVRIRVVNHLDHEATTLHPHGFNGHSNATDGVGYITQDPIRPGESYDYDFVADEASVVMYHSHHMSLHQVPNGLAGVLIVGDYAELAGIDAVSQEIAMMLNDAGNIGFSLNGKSFPATTPYVAKRGERLLVHYANEGLMAHPMHLHGQDATVIAKDGFVLDQPYRADTINVAPGERYTVLIEATDPGTWAWHCHVLSHVKRPDGSMFGMLTALIVE